MQAIIKFDHLYIDGGCNACGVVRCESYTLYYLDKEIGFGFLDLENLIPAIVQANGWRQSYEEVGIGEEMEGFKKGETFIQAELNGHQMTYINHTSGEKIMTTNSYKNDNAQLFATINEILTKLFDIEAIDFVMEEIDA
ncbi:DUF4809 family protein [Enterococcus columbae]|uniref:DUF4809 domain-containing protein n=1 Tax=Enterococcus columbae DSM 7374 = ATCC 51263 TaxID=1121865 RepID=S1P568_9ENTE|nr:DUF4809 family protein [Enterococcus columbae]EOT44618.1 hypothetical protein OMW_00674 [Enterococcus columbae DSM 7374 = ATCC 51263]EOW87486.1 hypothetical protein I568_00530 [Enterococcus columbae DSM 7374 = ATCC 51263]OJG25142.1 hypothetical protein RR47_GL001930 [Enterococcus columbae DSM 7374 = ATCC 51263]